MFGRQDLLQKRQDVKTMRETELDTGEEGYIYGWAGKSLSTEAAHHDPSGQ